MQDEFTTAYNSKSPFPVRKGRIAEPFLHLISNLELENDKGHRARRHDQRHLRPPHDYQAPSTIENLPPRPSCKHRVREFPEPVAKLPQD